MKTLQRMIKKGLRKTSTIRRRLSSRRSSDEDMDWHRKAVGGLWEEIGKLQLGFLIEQGLKPEHYLLDIGCGSLRGGVCFIDYLDVGHYYGIEKEESLLRAARNIELSKYGLEHKKPHLLLIDDFDLRSISQDVQFDFMLAQSVFTHLTPDMIELCLSRVMPRLRPAGAFYATFFESEDSEIDYGKPHPWRKNERGVAKYPFSLFQRIAGKVGGSVRYIGDWNHPRDQKMLAFRRS